MAEVGEGVARLQALIDSPQKCDHPLPDSAWRCKLDGDSGSLTSNLTAHCGVVRPKVPASVADVNARCWPSQAHHLIPWQQLRKHVVTQWLTTAPKKGTPTLLKDNEYSVDHGKNGKFMPYASSLKEWRSASTTRKKDLAEMVMAAAGIQLHQGPHSFKKYGHGDDGYKTRVDEYLHRIVASSLSHIWSVDENGVRRLMCEDCESKVESGKVPPRRNVRDFVDQASLCLEIDINLGRIFVSRRAAAFDKAGGVTY